MIRIVNESKAVSMRRQHRRRQPARHALADREFETMAATPSGCSTASVEGEEIDADNHTRLRARTRGRRIMAVHVYSSNGRVKHALGDDSEIEEIEDTDDV